MTVRSKIVATIKKVAREHEKTLAPLNDDLELLGSGLDSLSLAVIVVRLENELGVDPFTDAQADGFPVTLGDLVAAYARAVNKAAGGARGSL